jgi:hypothetical protein
MERSLGMFFMNIIQLKDKRSRPMTEIWRRTEKGHDGWKIRRSL